MITQNHIGVLIDRAADSKDAPETRHSQLDALLTSLIAATGEQWFQSWLDEKLAEIYPRPKRCLLDAVLQAFVAAAAPHCAYVLPALLRMPGSISLNAPLRRDISMLFRSNFTMHSDWFQQGAVCCSLVAMLACTTAEHVYTCHQHDGEQQQQQLHPSSSSAIQRGLLTGHQPSWRQAAQKAGTTISWLTDCLLQSVPQHKLDLLQLALAVFVQQYTLLEKLPHKQQHLEERAATLHRQACHPPPAKRARASLLLSSAPGSAESSAAANMGPAQSTLAANTEASSSQSARMERIEGSTALQAGLQLLYALSRCGTLQRNSQQLLLLAAVAAVQAAAATAGSSKHPFHDPFLTSLLQQLCQQVSASTSEGAIPLAGRSLPPIAAAAAAAAAPCTPFSCVPRHARQQQEQQLALSTITPCDWTSIDAFQRVVQHVAAAGCESLLSFTTSLMQTPAASTGTAAAPGAPGDCSTGTTQETAAAATRATNRCKSMQCAYLSSSVSSMPAAPVLQASTTSGAWQPKHLTFDWLQEAATQWSHAVPQPAAGRSSTSIVGHGRSSQAAASTEYDQARQIPWEQLLPPVPPVTASWVCKHMLPPLCWQVLHEWRLQQESQSHTKGLAGMTHAAALVHLLAADGLLLPASGEVLVSARAVASTVGGLPADLQEVLLKCWTDLLHVRCNASKQQTPGAAAAEPNVGAQNCRAQDRGQQQGVQNKLASTMGTAALLPWLTLQPMLCVLNHIGDLNTAPIAGFMAAALYSCAEAAAAASTGADRALAGCKAPQAVVCGAESSSARVMLKHLLLPVRFKLQVPIRAWLLRHLLLHERSNGPIVFESPADLAHTADAGSKLLEGIANTTHLARSHSAAVSADRNSVATHVLETLVELLSRECRDKLSEGLKQLSTRVDRSEPLGPNNKQTQAAPASTPAPALQASQARELADAMVQLLRQLQLYGASGQVVEGQMAAEMQPAVSYIIKRLSATLQTVDENACRDWIW